MTCVEVYCDGSISPAIMENIASSKIGITQIGRIIIVIPKYDYGFIEKIIEGVLTSKGNPDSDKMENLAVKRAKEICEKKKIINYMILTDNIIATKKANSQKVKWLEAGKLHYASLFLDRILSRARYLRQSGRKVINRAKPNKLQSEIYRMFNADKLEFKLSQNILWNNIQREMELNDIE